MRVEIWSDVACPWCYVGKRRFEAARRGLGGDEEVEVRWRAFELDPAAPPRRERDHVDHLAAKYGVTPAEAAGMIQRMTAAGAGAGLTLRFDVARPGNTFDAHRVAALAADRGLQDQVVERLFRATFTEGEPIADRGVLVRVAAEAGLDAAEVAAVLESGAYARQVRDDEALAARLGIGGVPFFVVDRTWAVGGAQPPEVLRELLERGRGEPEAATG